MFGKTKFEMLFVMKFKFVKGENKIEMLAKPFTCYS